MRILLLAVSLVASLLLAGCYQDEEIITRDIVETIPWPDHEEADYAVYDRDDKDLEELLQHGTLIVDRTGDQYEFQINFEGAAGAEVQGTDETSVLVDAMTLKPDFVRRERHLDDEDTVVEGTYDHETDVLVIKFTEGGEERTLPIRLDRENYYDNDESLFIWRTIPFAENYKANYDTVLPNVRSIQGVTIEVTAREEITVPGGTFDTWRLEIGGEKGLHQAAWFATSPDHRLVKYDNSQQLVVLTAYRGDSETAPTATTTPLAPNP
ncbi:MAG: hypothetical protein WEB04_04195 [Dehalococcoidia bacterium]